MLFTRSHTDHLSLIHYPSVLSSLLHRLKGLYNGAFQIKMGFSHWYCTHTHTHTHTRLPGRWRNPVVELVQTGQAILCFVVTCNLLCFHIHHISYIAQKTQTRTFKGCRRYSIWVKRLHGWQRFVIACVSHIKRVRGLFGLSTTPILLPAVVLRGRSHIYTHTCTLSGKLKQGCNKSFNWYRKWSTTYFIIR